MMHERREKIQEKKYKKIRDVCLLTFRESGQTLIEILIAIGLGMTVLTAMSIAIINGLNNTTQSKNQNIATEYAQEGMELVKQLQLSDYGTLQTLAGRYCLPQSCTALMPSDPTCGYLNVGGSAPNCAVSFNNQFIRQVDITQVGASGNLCSQTIQASVAVLWTDAKCTSGNYCHQEQVVSCLANLNPVQAP